MPENYFSGDYLDKIPKKTTFYASFLTGVVAAAAFIDSSVTRNIVTISAPLVTHFLTVCGKSGLHLIECKRGVKIYQQLIFDLEIELSKNPKPGRKKEIEQQLTLLRIDLQKARKAAIKVVVY